MKLTDTQLVLLSSAAQRHDGAVELGPKLKGSVSRKLLGRLLSEHLVEEIPAQGTLPGWRRDDDNGALALRITKRGLIAIGVDQGAEAGAAEACQQDNGAERQSGRAPRRLRPPANIRTRLGGSPPKMGVPSRSRRR